MDQFVRFFSFPKSFSDIEFDVHGREVLDNAFEKGKGIVFISGHIGAWELLSAWLGTNGYPTTVVIAKQKNRGSNQFIIEHRGQFGMKYVYRRSSIDEMYAILKRNESLALASDQDAGKRGVFVNFFNKKASTPKGAARFYQNSNCSLIFTLCNKIGINRFKIEFVPIVPEEGATIESITQSFTNILEDYIRKYPEQYFWFHRRWKTQPT
jgi:KDO2-lipid IV(A) lauroyltransferase